MTICFISFHPCIRKQTWPCHKNGQVQPSVTIWTNLVVIDYPMLNTKFQGHRPLGSEEILKGFTIYGTGSQLGHMTLNIWTNFHPNIPWRLHLKFGFKRPNAFWGKEVWKCLIWVTLDKGQWMTLTLGCHQSSCTHLFDYMYQLSPQSLQHFLANISHTKTKGTKFDLAVKLVKANSEPLVE